MNAEEAAAGSAGDNAMRSVKRKRLTRRMTVLAVVVLVAAAPYFVFAPENEDDDLPPIGDEFVEDTSAGTDPSAQTIDSAGDRGHTNAMTLRIGISRETGRVAGDFAYPTIQVLKEDNTRSQSPEGATGGQNVLIPPGVCGYSDPCHHGLPVRFEDDLDGLYNISEHVGLPADTAEWHHARVECYQSPWLIADCNIELAVGGYGPLIEAGFDENCLADKYRQRMGFAPPTAEIGWWSCASAWWHPQNYGNDLNGLCEAAMRWRQSAGQIVAPATEEPDGDSEEGLDDSASDAVPQNQPVAYLQPTETSYAVVCSALVEASLVRLAASEAPRDNENSLRGPSSDINETASTCSLALQILSDFEPAERARVPVCGVTLRPPIDTQQIIHSKASSRTE